MTGPTHDLTGPTRDLTGFQKPNRSGGLAGRLPPRGAAAPAAPAASPQAGAAETEIAGPADADPAPSPPASTRRRRAVNSRKNVAATEPETTSLKHSRSVYLPGPLFERLQAAQGSRSYAEVVLDGFEAVYEQLPDRFQSEVPSVSGLPPRTRRPRRGVDHLQEVHLRVTEAEFEVMEAKRAALGSPNRSEFVTGILDLYLAT